MSVQQFISKVLHHNKQFVDRFSSHLEKLKKGQSPECFVLMCGDSRCSRDVFGGDMLKLGQIFGGPANMGNILSLSMMATLSYNVDHLKTPFFVVCGHTGCGAIGAAMGDFSGEREPLKKELIKLKRDYESIENHPLLESSDKQLQNVFRNVQAQALKAIDEFSAEIEKGTFTVLGAVYDNQGELGEVGKLYFTSINGEYCFIS